MKKLCSILGVLKKALERYECYVTELYNISESANLRADFAALDSRESE